jgi:membrane protein YdbS with pleckstrin-like domain
MTETDQLPLVSPGPQRLHPAIKKVWQISALFSTLVLALVLGVPEFFLTRSDIWPFAFPWIGPTLAILIGVLSFVFAGRQWQAWSYQLREHDLVLAYGVFWRTRRSVARDRIQHVDINSGPLDRRFGLVQVSLYAAGAMGSVGSIPGLKPEDAEQLREALIAARALDA